MNGTIDPFEVADYLDRLAVLLQAESLRAPPTAAAYCRSDVARLTVLAAQLRDIKSVQ